MKSSIKKRDGMLRTAIVIVVIAMALGTIPVIQSVILSNQYKAYVDDYTDSINHARKNGGITLTHADKTRRLSNDEGSTIYQTILFSGMGKPQKNAPDGDRYVLSFPDGAELILIKTEIMEETRLQDEGVFIAFTNQEGKLYQYDTDKIDKDRIFNLLNK